MFNLDSDTYKFNFRLLCCRKCCFINLRTSVLFSDKILPTNVFGCRWDLTIARYSNPDDLFLLLKLLADVRLKYEYLLQKSSFNFQTWKYQLSRHYRHIYFFLVYVFNLVLSSIDVSLAIKKLSFLLDNTT